MSTKTVPMPAPAQSWKHDGSEVDNVAAEVQGDKLILTVDLKQNFGLSKSGKTTVVGSTRGFISIPTHPGVSLALNVVRRAR